ncbi:MAG: hypothetical protein AAFY84_03865 [Pseudomonadota bacterium]
MAEHAIAVLREHLCLCDDLLPFRAPSGEYEVITDENKRVCFSHRNASVQFSLSIDTVFQHMTEGRITMKNGSPIPGLAT